MKMQNNHMMKLSDSSELFKKCSSCVISSRLLKYIRISYTRQNVSQKSHRFCVQTSKIFIRDNLIKRSIIYMLFNYKHSYDL